MTDCVNGADENDAEISCSGALNRSKSGRVGYGFTGQVNFNQDWLGHQNLSIAGVGYDRSRTDFEQATEFGTLIGSRGVAGKVVGYTVENLDTRYNFGNTGWTLNTLWTCSLLSSSAPSLEGVSF